MLCCVFALVMEAFSNLMAMTITGSSRLCGSFLSQGQTGALKLFWIKLNQQKTMTVDLSRFI